MFNFIQPKILGDIGSFKDEYCKEILKCSDINATLGEQEAAKQTSHRLRAVI